MKGLRFERIGKGRYYNVVFHIGSTYIPVSDDTVEELRTQRDRKSTRLNSSHSQQSRMPSSA